MFAESLARASRRRVLLTGIAAAAASAGLSAAAQDAQAAFTLKECEGASGVALQGASFATAAQGFWRTQFNSTNGCGGTPTAPTYKGNGSGNGLASFGAGGGTATGSNALNCVAVAPTCAPPLPNGRRDLTTSAAGTDEPPDSEQTTRIEAGDTTTDADNGDMHVIPAATGSSTVIVNLPDGCNVTGVAAALKTNGTNGTVGGANTGDSEADGTSRLRLPNTVLEKVFAGDPDANEWGDVAEGLTGAPTNPQNSDFATCALVPIKRIVRQDVSGTTYGFKVYLGLINPGRGWLTTYATPDNRFWPQGNGSSTAVRPREIAPAASGQPARFCENVGPAPANDTTRLCSSTGTGNGNLSILLANTDGAIGYSDLATARSNGFEHTSSTSQSAQTDDRYWMPVQNNPGGTPDGYVEPTLDPTAHRIIVNNGQNVSTGSRGANCSTVTISGAPTPANSPKGDPTLGDWGTTAAAGGAGYPACVLTYILAWDDNAPIYGNTVAEEAKARTVKDFLTKTVVSGFGQGFAGQDYSSLPSVLLSYAQTGVNAIDWNKSATVNQPPPTTTTTTTPATTPATTAGGTPPPPVVTTPPKVTQPPVVARSNRYSVSSGRVNKAKTTITYTVKVRGRGTLRSVSSYLKRVGSRNRTIKVSTVTSRPTRASTFRVVVRLTRANRADLKRLKRLRIATRFTYTPAGGTAASQRKAANLRR